MRTANSDQTGHLFSLGVHGIMLVLSCGGSIKRSPRSATYKDRTQTTPDRTQPTPDRTHPTPDRTQPTPDGNCPKSALTCSISF